MKTVYVRVAVSKRSGKKYACIVLVYGNGAELTLFANSFDYCKLLNKTPQEFDALECGNYEIV